VFILRLANIASATQQEAAIVRILLLHDTRHDLPAVETALAANGDEVRSMAVNALTLHVEIERWNPTLILIAADDAARDVLEHVCVASQHQERPIVMFTEDEDPVAMRAAMRAGVAAYVVAGLAPQRLRSVIGVALERFSLDQQRLADLSEAKLTADAQSGRDRVLAQAKALLRRRGMTEPEAYAALRTQAMRERCSVAEAAERLLHRERA
jgi:two-component system, response regulator / RNA-binding antiterminator